MRLLFLTPRFPYPPLKGDSLRVYHQLRMLSREHQIVLVSMSEGVVSEAEYAQVADLCERVVMVPLLRWRVVLNLVKAIISRQPMQVGYYRSAEVQQQLDTLLASERFDVVHATLIRMLPYVWGIQDTPVVVDLIDSLSLNLEERRGQVRGLKRLAYEMEYRRVREYEQAVVERFPALIVSSEADRLMLAGENVKVTPNGVDVERFPFHGLDGRDEATLVFTGNMGYHPNEEAVLWFVAEVWPLLRAERSGLSFQIVGTKPSKRVRSLAREDSGIEVLGRVPDVVPFLRRATMAVCPMQSGSGIQNKVLEAMAVGAPVIATSTANRGVHGVPERDLLVADTAPAFATAITRLLDEPAARARLADAGRAFVEENYLWEQHAQQLSAIYAETVQGSKLPDNLEP